MKVFIFANRINHLLERGMPVLTVSGVLLGVLLPGFFLELRPLAPWLFAFITLSGALKLRARELGRAVSSPLPLLLFFLSSRIIMPLLVYFISQLLFGAEPDTVAGFVLLYSVPTAILGFIWVSIFRGNYALSLTLILLDSVLAPFMVPLTLRLLVGTSVSINVTAMIVALIFMVVIPTILGVSMNEQSHGKIPYYSSPWLDPLSKVCIFIVVAANSAAVAPQFHPANIQLWIIFAVCVGFSFLGFFCARFTCFAGNLVGKLNQETQTTLLFAIGLKNISAALTLAIEFFPPGVALPILMGILFQQANAAIVGRIFLGKIAKEDKSTGGVF
ncbi:MAG: hypothetical protein FWH19_05995 [Treponema sp.]|nr:hypothetical protein [Treponema sp.]